MAKKSKFDLNSPSIGQMLIKDAMAPYSVDMNTIPQSYGINELSTDIPVVVPKDLPERSNDRNWAEKLLWKTGKGLVTALDELKGLGNYAQKERLEVGLSKLQDNLMETEARWIPEINEAQQYLQAKAIVDQIPQAAVLDESQKQAVQTVRDLESKVKESAKRNPYLVDLFYETNPLNAVDTDISARVFANELRDDNIFNFNPFNNIRTALSDGVFNDDQINRLWNRKQVAMSDEERLERINTLLKDAQEEYDDKTEDIVKRQNTIKKGGWLYDPTALTKEFEDKVNNSELSITDPSSWFYNLGHIGSSLSEAEMMMMQTGASILANKAARSLAVRGALNFVPYAGQVSMGLAIGEQAMNLWLAKYYRQSETASEVFDNYQQRALNAARESKVQLGPILDTWETQLEKLGYPVDQMESEEILQAGLAQGLTTDQQEFEDIRKESFQGLQMVRDVNDALSYSDYMQSLPFSYGGKILWNRASKALAKSKGLQRPFEEVPTAFEQLGGLERVVEKTVNKALRKTSKDVGKNITRRHLINNIGSFAKANGVTFISERNEEGTQNIVGSRYQRGEYDYLGERGVNPIYAAYEAGVLGLEANMAYFGLSNDNYLNTDAELKKSMDIGGFIGLVMPILGNGVKIKDMARQYASDRKMNEIVSKGYDHAEKDNKMDVFLDAVQQGKDVSYVTDYLESMKSFKQPGVTDEMIDQDKRLATNLWAEYRNTAVNPNLKQLGIKKGSDLHKKFVKNYLHINDRLQDAEEATNQVNSQLEKLITQGKAQKDDVFVQMAKVSYDQFVKEMNKVISTDDLISLEAYSDLLYDIAFLKLQQEAARDLTKHLQARKRTLQELANDTGLDIDFANINNIREYAKAKQKQIEQSVSSVIAQYGIKNLDQLQDPINSDEIKKYITASIMNMAVRDRLQSQALAYITGRLDIDTSLDTHGYLFKDLTTEQQDAIVAQAIDDATKSGEPIPSRKSIIAKYNQDIQTKIAADRESANRERLERRMANRLFQEHLNKGIRQEKVAQKEKEDEGEVLPKDAATPLPATEAEISTEAPVAVETEGRTAPEPTPEERRTEPAEPIIPEPRSTTSDLADDILREEDEAQQRAAKQMTIEPASDDVAIQTEEEVATRDGISAEEQERESIIAREEGVTLSNTMDSSDSSVTYEEASPEALEIEDAANRSKQDTDDVSGVSEQTSDNSSRIEEQPVVEERIEEAKTTTKDESDPVPPTPDQVDRSKITDEAPVITIVDGGLYVDGTTFVSDETLTTIEQINEDISTEVYGETGYANMHPETVTNNSDALSNRKIQKVKHVANTFFFQPNATEPMKVTVNGKPVVFTNNKGEVLPVLPGATLAKRLLKRGWIDNCNTYYIVTNHRYGDSSPYMQAIHLVIEDTDGVMIASLRTPDYVDKEIASGNYDANQVRQLEQQKDQLIKLRQQIVNAYLGSNKTIPTTPLKSVKPAKLRTSNGEFNNQRSADGAPIRRKLTEVTDLGLSKNDVRKLDEQVKDLEIGYGTGDVSEFLMDPLVIRKLGSDKELTSAQGKGRSGALYLIPKPDQTPTGNVAPVQLSIRHLDTDIYGEDVELGKDGKVNSVAELAYKLLTGQMSLGIMGEEILDIIVNHGNKTLVSEEVGQKYPFLMDKMLYYDDGSNTGNPHIQFAVKDERGRYIKVEFDPAKANESQAKLAIRKIAKDLHWNTDKEALLEPLPQRLVDTATAYFKQYPDKKVFTVAGLKELSFTREDLGIGMEGGPVSLLTWMINTGKIQTDLGDTIYRAPFIYTDGVATPQVTETELIIKEFEASVEELVKKAKENKNHYHWARYISQGYGYEVSTKGDKRFSALVATFKEGTVIDGVNVGGMTIEQVYQSVIKKSRKGQPPARTSKLYNESLKTKHEREEFSYKVGYLPLWQEWAKQNPELIEELRTKVNEIEGRTLTDQFATTLVSQAKALAEILNSTTPTVAKAETEQTTEKQSSGIEYVSTEENWSEDQIKDWMKANTPAYKYKPGKWQVIRRNGKLQAAQKLAKRGLTSINKGEGRLNVDEAKQWLQDTLGIDKADVITSEAVFRMANAPTVYGALKVCMDRLSNDRVARIFLSTQSGEGVEYHEAFHYVSNLLLNDKVREQVYQDYVNAHPDMAEASKQEVEEALAEEFSQYMLDEKANTIRYRIKKAFRALKSIFGFNKNGRLVRNLFQRIQGGEFAKYRPSQSLMQEFEQKFGGELYYYIPGVADTTLKKMASIADASTFYAVVDSLNATVMDAFNINSIEDIANLGKKIDDIFDDILATNVELGVYDESTEQLIKDVIANKEVFKKQIDDYLRNFSIIKKNTEEVEEEELGKRDTGETPDNTWDKESYTISKKANVAFKAKLFFYSIPKTRYEFDTETGQKVLVEEEDDLLMTTRSEDFNVVWNKVLENLWNVESYIDMVDRCYNLGKVDPFFMTLYNKLNSKDDPIDEVTQTQILNTVKSAKNAMMTIVVEENYSEQYKSTAGMSDEQIEEVTKNYVHDKLRWRLQNADVYRKISRLPKRWSQSFFLSDLIAVDDSGNRTIDLTKYDKFVHSHKLQIDALMQKKNKTNDDYIAMRNHFIELCNNLSIQMDDTALDYLLTNGDGTASIDDFIEFWQNSEAGESFNKSILFNLRLAALQHKNSIKTRSGKDARTFDRIFTTNKPTAQINQIAIAWGRTHPTPEEFSVTGADGNLVYPITENNYMSDQVRWLKYNLNGKRDLLNKNPYSANSILLNGIINNPDAIKLNTFLNFEEPIQDTNRDYFGISPLEDYIAKMTFGFSNNIFCPTMSDKKTWHTISGVTMVKDFLARSEIVSQEFDQDGNVTRVVYGDIKPRFSNRTLDIFKGYLRDEYNAISKYYATKQKVIDNPNLNVGNYYGSKKGKYSDGNGGRFRYFNKLTINGETYNLNEILAKAEYSNDTESIQDLLNVIKQALDNDTIIRNAINDVLIDYVNNEIDKAIDLGLITSNLENRYIPLNFVDDFNKIIRGKDDKDKKKKGKDKKEDVKNSENVDKDIIYSIVASHAINSAISTIEIEKCFTGDPALYKWQKELMIYKPNDNSFIPVVSDERSLQNWTKKHLGEDDDPSEYSAYYMITGRDVDKIKRLSSVLSTGTNLRTKWGQTKGEEENSDPKFQVLQLADNEIGSTVYDTLYQMFRKSLIKDMFQKEFDVTDQQALNAVKDDHAIESTLGRLRKKNPDAIDFIEKQAKASASPYSDGSINQADAAVYIRPEFYKRLMKSLGEWSDEIEEAYNIMEADDSWLSDPEKYAKAIKAITQPLKMVYFGDHFDKVLGMNVNTFDKMALFPLFKTFAKADNKYLYDRMNDTEKGVIDMVAFESAIKVGGRKKLNFYDDGKVNTKVLDEVSDVDGVNGKGLATYTQDLTQIRLQLNTDPHEHLDRAFGTQAIKIGFANVVDSRTYGENKGLSIKGSEIKKNIMDAINSLSRIGRNKIKKEFFTDGTVDNKKLTDYLRKQAINSGMSAEIVANLTVDENGNVVVPIEAQSIRDWIQSKVTSFVNKTVVDVNTPGGSAIQMSSFAYEAVGRNVDNDKGLGTAFNNGKKLKFLAKEGHMQVILSENFFRDILPNELKGASFTAKRKWLIENGIIGSRTERRFSEENQHLYNLLNTRVEDLGFSLRANKYTKDNNLDTVFDIANAEGVPQEISKEFDEFLASINVAKGIAMPEMEEIEIESKPYGVGYRIPTQGLSSMFSFQVADIMPTTIGDTIIVPEEFTAMTGSDFDVDKLYLATYAYRNGKRVNSDERNEAGYVNKLLDMYSFVLTDFTNIAETRASIDTLTKILQKQILPKVQPKNVKEVAPMYELAPSFQLSRKTEYTGGKAGIAPFALNSTNHALTQFTHLCMNYANGNRYGLGTLDAIKGEDDQRIMDWLSAMVNAHVDVAKDPYIMTLNVNAITYNMTSLLLRGGKGESTFYFLAQPMLRRFTKEMLESKGIIGVEKTVTEREKLAQLARESMESLRDAVVVMDDADENKAKYAQYYNGLAAQYGLSSIDGYEAVNVNYNDVFDKKLASAALTNPESVQGYYQQVISLRAYADLLSDTEVLSNLVQLSQIDTKKFGNTLPLQLNFQRRLNRFINNNSGKFYISNNDNIEKPLNYYLQSTFLRLKLDSAINTPRILLSGQVIEATKSYKALFNAACDYFIGNSSDKELVKELSKVITTSLRARAVSNNIEDFQISDKKFLNMLIGPKTVTKQLTYIKNILRKRNDLPGIAYNGVIKNELLLYLQEYAADGERQIFDKIVTADNALTNTATYENRLLSAYQDLLDCGDESIRKFADRLGMYAYFTSFDNRGVQSFFDVITTAWKQSKGYTAVIKSAIEILNQDGLVGMDYFGYDAEAVRNGNFTEMFTDIARNAFTNDKLVKPIELKYVNNYSTLVQVAPNSKTVPAVFSSGYHRDPFVKVKLRLPDKKFRYVMYQKIGVFYQVNPNGDVVRDSENAVYKMIPALGTKDDKKTYFEYHKLSGEQSAFESNALPAAAIYTNKQAQDIVFAQQMKFAEKKGNQVVYESTDAITVKATAQSNFITQPEVPQNTFGSDLEATNELNNVPETSSTVTVGEEVTDVPAFTVGEDDSMTISDMQTDMYDGTQTIMSNEVLDFTDEIFGESPYFDTIMNSGIEEYESVQQMIEDANTTTENVEDMRFNDEAYKHCKGE